MYITKKTIFVWPLTRSPDILTSHVRVVKSCSFLTLLLLVHQTVKSVGLERSRDPALRYCSFRGVDIQRGPCRSNH